MTASCVRIVIHALEQEALLPGPTIVFNHRITDPENIKQLQDELPGTMHRVWHVILSMPIVVLMGTFTLVCAWSLTSLVCFHAMIITLAQTTNERVRGVYRYGGAVNTANNGCCHNWFTAILSRRPPSRLPEDFLQVVVGLNRPETVWRPMQNLTIPNTPSIESFTHSERDTMVGAPGTSCTTDHECALENGNGTSG